MQRLRNPPAQATVAAVSARRVLPTVLALHGFTLGGGMFAELSEMLAAEVIAPDLPGHGGRGAEHTDWRQAVAEVAAMAHRYAPDLVLGYSMGGRIALAAALHDAEAFPGLVLVSTSLGIAEPADRRRRRAEDEKLAKQIEEQGLEQFLADWGRNPILATTETAVDLASLRRHGTAQGITAALRGMGQGSQPYLLPNVPGLSVPVDWIAGSLDDKYVAIAHEAAAASPRVRAHIVAGVGHNVVAERADAVAAVVMEQLSRRNV